MLLTKNNLQYNFENKTVLIAPLNWGLGHATRCIPIINYLIKNNCSVIIASDGAALEFLIKEFPTLNYHKLPSYNITYSKNKFFFKWKLFFQAFHFVKTYFAENKSVNNIIKDYNIDVVISDNRFGINNREAYTIYITHQVYVKSGFTSWLTTKIHEKIISKYNECYIPDFDFKVNGFCLAGKLSQRNLKNTTFIGPLSRLEFEKAEFKFDVLVLLSGPEPQRQILEDILILELGKSTNLRIAFVKGIVAKNQIIEQINNVKYFNYATSFDVQYLMNRSEFVICRSGYTTIMDLYTLTKKAILIPTPGQDEQEYLANYHKNKGLFTSIDQHKFDLNFLYRILNKQGLPNG